jgi:hypothetical protein
MLILIILLLRHYILMFRVTISDLIAFYVSSQHNESCDTCFSRWHYTANCCFIRKENNKRIIIYSYISYIISLQKGSAIFIFLLSLLLLAIIYYMMRIIT